MMDVSYGVRCSFQRTPIDNNRRGGTIVWAAIKRLQLLTSSPAVVRHSFAAAAVVVVVAETARDIRRSLLPSTSPLEQNATRRSLRRNVDRSARGHRRTDDRGANRLIYHEPRYAPFRK